MGDRKCKTGNMTEAGFVIYDDFFDSKKHLRKSTVFKP